MIGVWILGDQLHPQQAALASLADYPPAQVPVLLVESRQWVQRRPYHRQKLALVWSAMRHFGAELSALGHPVTYAETETFAEAVIEFCQQHQLTALRLMTPADIPFRAAIRALTPRLPCPIEWLENSHFLWERQDFLDWAKGRKRLVMEDFYRLGRQRFGILLDEDQPVGGRWNFDKENRRPPRSGLSGPARFRVSPDAITQAAIAKVDRHCPEAFGDVASFGWAVTRTQALQALEHFCQVCLPTFGPFQDAMVLGEDTMWHALLSPYLNLGLLTPHEVIQAAEQAYRQDLAPLPSVEGFIRQVLGWREYMRGLYELLIPQGYTDLNAFDHQRPVPAFFWTGDTPMTCLRETINQIKRTGYAHHIQRLMILGNFALISGMNPQAVEDWFHSVFIDSYDWVMQTNVLGMGLFADGGKLATKPYAASANYVKKMSNYCHHCQYRPDQKIGPEACPFNTFYWDFLSRHRPFLTKLGRMGLVLSHLDRLDPSELSEIQQQAEQWWRDQPPEHTSSPVAALASDPN